MPAETRRALIEQAATDVFAERGFHGAQMEAIAKRAGVTVPVVYDHFPSKQHLHRSLLERHYAALRASWQIHLDPHMPPEQRMRLSLEAFFDHVQAQPEMCRMLFHAFSGDPQVDKVHRDVALQSWATTMATLAQHLGMVKAAKLGPTRLQLAGEALRAALQGMALWWLAHPKIPRDEVVSAAMNLLWQGLQRLGQGEIWQATPG